MEFKSLKNIGTSFRQIRLFTLVVICLCTALAGYSVWSAFAEAQSQKIYVLDSDKSLMLALSQDLSQNRPAEAKEHVSRFHELFFTLSPDKNAIKRKYLPCAALGGQECLQLLPGFLRERALQPYRGGKYRSSRAGGQRTL